MIIMVAVTAVTVFLAVLLVKAAPSGKAGPVSLNATASMPTGVDESLRAIASDVGTLKKHTSRPGPPGVLFIDRSYWAWWRVIIAILLFPIGLLVLTGRDRRTATVTVTEADRGSSLTVTGSVYPELRAVLSQLATTRR